MCCFDGIHNWKQKSKVISTIVVALICLIISFQHSYVWDSIIITIPFIGKYGEINLNAKISSSYWILFLFFMKIAVKSWRKGKDGCILVHCYPLIKWDPMEDEHIISGNIDDSKASMKRAQSL